MSAVLVGALMATMLHAVVAGAEPAWAAPVAPTGPAVHGVTKAVVVPPAQTELVPTVALSYDSSAIDGRTSATAAQSSWVGDGWDTPDSYRRLPSGAGPAVK